MLSTLRACCVPAASLLLVRRELRGSSALSREPPLLSFVSHGVWQAAANAVPDWNLKAWLHTPG